MEDGEDKNKKYPSHTYSWNKLNKEKLRLQEELKTIQKLKWECLKRNKEYKKQCRENNDLIGKVHPALCKKFGIEFIADPNRSYNHILPHPFPFLLDKDPVRVITNEDTERKDCVFHDNEIVLSINILAGRKHINNRIKEEIDAKLERYKNENEVREKRYHVDKIATYLKIWDLKEKEKDKSFEEIAKIVFKTEWKEMISLKKKADADVDPSAYDQYENKKTALIEKINKNYRNAKKIIEGGYKDLK